MARRGFFAELQHQARVAERERVREAREVARQHAALIRRVEQARAAEERLRKQMARAEAAEQRRLEKAAREAHIESMEAEVAERNSELAEINEDLDSILTSTLHTDDFVDLATLRIVVEHPDFDAGGLDVPTPWPEEIVYPPQPELVLPEEPRGLFKFLSMKKYAADVEAAELAHAQATVNWRAKCRQVEARRQALREKHKRDEAKRLENLNLARMKYAEECRVREAEAAASNRRLDELIANLGYGAPAAVQEYVSIVLSNSVYPDHFSVTHEFEFEPTTAELQLKVGVPTPDAIPDVKAFKYSRASDEITSTKLSQKDCRDRYAHAIHQIALRSIHEVFEADRRGLIRSISLEVGTDANDPATGRRTFIPFVIVAAERDSFMEFDLSVVEPSQTLIHLGAAVSKNPYGLVAAVRAGVRRA